MRLQNQGWRKRTQLKIDKKCKKYCWTLSYKLQCSVSQVGPEACTKLLPKNSVCQKLQTSIASPATRVYRSTQRFYEK